MSSRSVMVQETRKFNTEDPVFWIKAVGSVLVAFLVIGLLLGSFTKVQAGQSCLRLRGGAERGAMTPGYNTKIPIIEGKSCFSTLLITYEASLVGPEDSSSEADYVDYSVQAKSNDGVNFQQPFVIHYKIDTTQVEYIYNNVAKTDGRLKEKVKDLIRAEIPSVISTYSADSLYLGNIDKISAEVAERLTPQMETMGVDLIYFKLKKGDFDDYYENAIAAKAQEVEAAKKKKIEQETAKAEAERIRIQAEGDAAQVRIAAQADADATLIKAQAQAESEQTILNARAEVINANPALVTWHQIDMIQSANVIYLPSDTGLIPILNLPSGPEQPAKE